MPDRDFDRRIVEVLLNHSKMTLPRLAKVLNSNVGTVDYHLRKLAEKKIVIVEKKRYGSTYRLNLDLINVDKKLIVQLALSLSTLLFGLFMLFRLEILYATLCFLISSVLGVYAMIKEYKRQSREKLNELLESL